MAITTNFSSASTEQRWVDQISKKFIREVSIDISDENPICVFNIPKSITIFKPEAYLPHVIALGPYHHMNPHVYHMERYKIACAKSFFDKSHSRQGITFREVLIKRLKELDHVVRGCYHNYLDFDDTTLSWIMTIDGMFLINLLQDYFVDLKGNKILARDAILSRDLLLVENQIPFVVLKEISKTLINNSCGKDVDESKLLFMMVRFCIANSPIDLSSVSSCSLNEISHLHLLDLMYHLVINNGFPETESALQDEERLESQTASSEDIEVVEEDINSACGNISEITKVAMKFGIGRKILKPVQVIQDIPWDKILTSLGLNTDKDKGKYKTPVVEEIKIPSVSSLHYYAGITFRSTTEGIRGIKFVEEEAALYLPQIILDANSEVVLRNLVAYETAMNYSHSSLSISLFVDLISGVIDSAEDSRLLKQNGIIKGELTNDRIAELFNGINKGTRNNSGNKIVAEINNYYKKRLIVKIFKFTKKRLFSLWKVITHLLTVFLLLLLILYSFCQFYGCSKLLGGSS